MINEIIHECADCGTGVSEFSDIHGEETDEHYCKECADEIGIYKCHWCGLVYDVEENKSTCPECGRRPE